MIQQLPRCSRKLLPILGGLMVIGPFGLAPLLGSLQFALVVLVLVPPVLFVLIIWLGWQLDKRRFDVRAIAAQAIVVSIVQPEDSKELRPDSLMFVGLEIHLPDAPRYTAVTALRFDDPLWKRLEDGDVMVVHVDPHDPQRVTLNQRLDGRSEHAV